MSKSEIVVGLDIGTTKVCAIVGQLNENGKINVLGMGKSSSLGGVQRGVVANISRTVEAIEKAVEKAVRSSNVDIKTVNVGIAGQHIKSLQHSGLMTRRNIEEEISGEEIDQLRKNMYNLALEPGTEIIHIFPQDFKIDNEPNIKEPVGMMGVRIEGNFHIITGQVAAAQNIIRCVEKAGLEVVDLIVEPIASSRAVLTDEEKEAGVVLVDIGGGTSDIAIFHDGIIKHTAVIPFGGNVITSDLQKAFSILESQAEELKMKFGHALPEATKSNEMIVVPGISNRRPKEISTRNVSRVINARVEEMFRFIDNQIVMSGLKSVLNAGIVLTGGGSQLKDVTQLLEFVTGMEVNLGFPNEHLAKGMVDEVKSPMYATTIGLVLSGFEQEMRNANFEGNNIKEKRNISAEKQKGSDFFRKIKSISGGFSDWLKDDEDMDDYN
jgi:cell division protein FtsA